MEVERNQGKPKGKKKEIKIMRKEKRKKERR